MELNLNFSKLKENITNKNKINNEAIFFKQDIDLLFETKDQIIYLEIKYNDDHDTGKFADIMPILIFRKLITSYFNNFNF